jgi:alcohol dehydrogenase/propanol-preferring alcohol dehydrogenase
VAVTGSPDKRQLIRDFGADHIVSNGEELRGIGGADVLLVTGTSYSAATDSVRGVRPGGRIVLAGIDPAGSFTIGATSPIWAKRIQVIGASHNGLNYLAEALDLVARGVVTPVLELFDKRQLPEAVDRLAQGAVRFRAVAIF